MKITAGLGSIDDYISYVHAGADELFCGYVPHWWTQKYGIFAPLNRREVLYYNVQIGSESEMKLLNEMICQYQVPVSITLNALSYLPEQYPDLIKYIQECLSLGFSSFIIADLALLVYLNQSGFSRQIHLVLSGEYGELNHYHLPLLKDLQLNRIIFHRKMTFSEMKSCSSDKNLEYEAFFLNENCHFHGAFCQSLHCDELCHICRLPYQLSGISVSDSVSDSISVQDNSLPGFSGCGLCALWDLDHAGITHLKIVGRGNYSKDMERDISIAVKARTILTCSTSRDSYIREMKQQIFPTGCSGNCYYFPK